MTKGDKSYYRGSSRSGGVVIESMGHLSLLKGLSFSVLSTEINIRVRGGQ